MKKNTRKKILKRISLTFASIAFLFSVFYLLVALTQNPSFVIRDIQDKYAKIAGTSSAMAMNVRFTGAPGKPTLTATAGCTETNPYVDLSWNSTSDTNDYNLTRDSLPLINNITQTSYHDDAVGNNTTYAYQVTANGPLGSTSSDVVNATTGDCTLNVPVSCKIQTLNNKQISSLEERPKIKDHTPTFSGNTNTPNAIISIMISGDTSLFATIYANSNGFWSFEPDSNLNHGDHVIIAIATDPLNSLRYGSDSLSFKIEKEETGTGETESEETVPPIVEIPNVEIPITPTPGSTIPPEETEKIYVPFALNLTVQNAQKRVSSGDAVELGTKIIHYVDGLKDFTVNYEIEDENGNAIKSFSENYSSSKNETFKKDVFLPTLMKTGKYKITAKTSYGKFNITAEDYFYLVERPAVNLGGGFFFTLTELLQNASWIVSIMLLLLLFFLLMLIIEHYLSQKALFHITENFLKNKGFFSEKKGGANE